MLILLFQVLPMSAVLTFWAENYSLWGTVLCIVGCLIAFLVSTIRDQ